MKTVMGITIIKAAHPVKRGKNPKIDFLQKTMEYLRKL